MFEEPKSTDLATRIADALCSRFSFGSEKARELAGEPVGFCGAEPVRPR